MGGQLVNKTALQASEWEYGWLVLERVGSEQVKEISASSAGKNKNRFERNIYKMSSEKGVWYN